MKHNLKISKLYRRLTIIWNGNQIKYSTLVVVFLIFLIPDLKKSPTVSHEHRKLVEKLVQVSVIIPFYSGVDYLANSIESVCRQSNIQEIEIIIVNDASQESEEFYQFAMDYYNSQIMKKLILEPDTRSIAGKRKGRSIYFASSRINKGPAGARNYGIALSSGNWILAIDSDDSIDTRFFEFVEIELQKHGKSLRRPGNINLISPDIMYKFSNGLNYYREKWQPAELKTKQLFKKNTFHSSVLFKKSLSEKITYNQAMIFGWEDWDFWININIQEGIQPVYVRKPIFLYNQEKSYRISNYCNQNKKFCKEWLILLNSLAFGPRKWQNALQFFFEKAKEHPEIARIQQVKEDNKKYEQFQASHTNNAFNECRVMIVEMLFVFSQGKRAHASRLFESVVKKAESIGHCKMLQNTIPGLRSIQFPFDNLLARKICDKKG